MVENNNDEPAKSLQTTSFDVIVLGTGLTESLIASYASKIGKKTVLVLDANDHYGNSFGTLEARIIADKFKGWTVPRCLLQTESILEIRDLTTIDDDYDSILSSLYRKFSLDIAFKFSLGDDQLIEEVCNSEAYKYIEFKTLEKSFVAVKSDGTNGNRAFEFIPVPASRSEIFESTRLSPAEKRGLMRFLKRARDVALEGTGVNYGRGDDANTPIGAPGTEYKLDVEGDESESMKEKKNGVNGDGNDKDSSFAYAFVNNDKNNNDSSSGGSVSKDMSMKSFLMESPNELSEITSDAVAYCVSFCPSAKTALRGRAAEMLKTYIRSMGKYGPQAPQAGLIPLYGCGEFAQAFCRVAAVSGAITALRQSIMKIERKHIRSDDGDKVGGINKYCNDVACGSENNIEVTTNGGRVLTCKKLVLGDAQGDIEMVGFANDEMSLDRKTSKFCINRAVLVTNGSMIGNDDAQQRVFFAIPAAARPRKRYNDEDEFVCFATQLDHSSRCCPKDTLIVHLCQKSRQTVLLEDVFADIIDNLFTTAKNGNENGEETTESKKPTILWGTSYRMPDVVDDDVSFSNSNAEDFVKFPGPDCNATFEHTVNVARSASCRLFGDMNASSPSLDTLSLFPKAQNSKEKEEERSIDDEGDKRDDDSIDLNDDEYALLRDL